MRIFFDTNVLLDRFYGRAGALASEQAGCVCASGKHEGWIAWYTLSNDYYLVRSEASSKATALQFINDLLAWTEVAVTSTSSAQQAVAYAMSDFENALQVAAALACRADVILTRNLSDFASSSIPATTPEDFLALPLIVRHARHLRPQSLA